MDISKTLKLLYFTAIVGSLFISVASAQGSVLASSLCNIVNQVKLVIGILALLLFILGGTMYAAAHLLPAAGNLRGNLQGWSMGMIVGGVVGIILVLLAGPLLGIIASLGGSTGSTINTSLAAC